LLTDTDELLETLGELLIDGRGEADANELLEGVKGDVTVWKGVSD